MRWRLKETVVSTWKRRCLFTLHVLLQSESDWDWEWSWWPEPQPVVFSFHSGPLHPTYLLLLVWHTAALLCVGNEGFSARLNANIYSYVNMYFVYLCSSEYDTTYYMIYNRQIVLSSWQVLSAAGELWRRSATGPLVQTSPTTTLLAFIFSTARDFLSWFSDLISFIKSYPKGYVETPLISSFAIPFNLRQLLYSIFCEKRLRSSFFYA